MSEQFTCAILEDEPLAQNILKKFIGEHPLLELVACCSNAAEAQMEMMTKKPFILFLDINLPGLSGINFLKSLPHPPLVVFTTAYPEYAVQGFELDAVDYLVKPFSFERFLKAANKAIGLLQKEDLPRTQADAIFLKADKKVHKINLADIIYIEAAGDYAKVVTTATTLLVNETMKNLEKDLPPYAFLRIHKSYIISRDKIRFFEGNYVKVGEADLPIGNAYKEDIAKHLKGRNN